MHETKLSLQKAVRILSQLHRDKFIGLRSRQTKLKGGARLGLGHLFIFPSIWYIQSSAVSIICSPAPTATGDTALSAP